MWPSNPFTQSEVRILVIPKLPLESEPVEGLPVHDGESVDLSVVQTRRSIASRYRGVTNRSD
jgi:hypothetical protein